MKDEVQGRSDARAREILHAEVRGATTEFLGWLTGLTPPTDREAIPPEMRPAFDKMVNRLAKAAETFVTPTPIADSSEAGTGGDPTSLSNTSRKIRIKRLLDKISEPDSILEYHFIDGDVTDAGRMVSFGSSENLQRPELDLLIEGLRALSAPVREPFGYAILADNGNVRVWWRDKASADAHEKLTGTKPTPIYTHPPAPAVGAEEVARINAPVLFEKYDTELASGRKAENGRLWAEVCWGDEIKAEIEKAERILSLLSIKAG